ncbi:MAG TPA: hypothetical protein DCL88_03500, partial [Gammaproteobacteria bacterium]|nr:hypothetical protein [Gammaproteobacteria bacterium]
AALQRREVYATSGTRIKLRLHQTFAQPSTINCASVPSHSTPMGGTFASIKESAKPTFIIQAMQDRTPLAAIDLIKLRQNSEGIEQKVIRLGEYPTGQTNSCIVWTDHDYTKSENTLWYVRVLEQPTQRWDQKSSIQERAWSSPIWSAAH